MTFEVRSDYNISLKIIDPDGNEMTAGSFHSLDTLNSYDQAEALPHLQRKSPSGDFLATLSNHSIKVRLDSLDSTSNQWQSRTFRIKGVQGKIQEMRWLPEDAGLALRTWENVYLVPFDPHAPDSIVKAQKAFHPQKMKDAPIFLSMRSTDRGLLFMTHEIPWSEVREIEQFGNRVREQRNMAAYDPEAPLQGYFLPIVSGRKRNPIALRPHGRNLQFINTLSDNRIVVVSNPRDVPPGEQLGAATADVQNPQAIVPNVPANPQHVGGTLQVFDVKEFGDIELISSVPCGKDGICQLHNWSPSAKRILYSDDFGKIFLEKSKEEIPGSPTFVELPFSEDYYVNVHALWLNKAENRVVAASPGRIRVWDGEGNILWTWNHSEELGRIGSVQFAQDGEAILVAVGNEILRIRDGKSEVLVKGKHDAKTRRKISRRTKKERRRGKRRHTPMPDVYQKQFIDGIVPLPDGSIAFAVVTAHFENIFPTAD